MSNRPQLFSMTVQIGAYNGMPHLPPLMATVPVHQYSLMVQGSQRSLVEAEPFHQFVVLAFLKKSTGQFNTICYQLIHSSPAHSVNNSKGIVMGNRAFHFQQS